MSIGEESKGCKTLALGQFSHIIFGLGLGDAWINAGPFRLDNRQNFTIRPVQHIVTNPFGQCNIVFNTRLA